MTEGLCSSAESMCNCGVRLHALCTPAETVCSSSVGGDLRPVHTELYTNIAQCPCIRKG